MKRGRIAMIVTVILLLAFLQIIFEGPLTQWLELKSIDWRFQRRGPIPATGEVVVVAIDEKSLYQEGRWPWSRHKIARLIHQIRQSGAKWIEMDIVFAETSPHDAVLATELRQSRNVILGYFFYQDEQELKRAEIAPDLLEQSYRSIEPTALPEISGLSESLIQMAGVVSNTPGFVQATRSVGYFNTVADPDGVIRRFPLMVSYRGKIFPSLALETLSYREGGFDAVPVRTDKGRLRGLSLGPRYIPTNQRGQFWINYRGGREPIPVLSAVDVLSGQVEASALNGKTVLIGATAIGIYDLRMTPLSTNFPGVLIQANLLDNLYRGDFLISNQWTRLASLLITGLLLIGLGLLLPRLRILYGLLILAVTIGLHVWFTQWSFNRHLIITQVVPVLHWSLLYIVLTIYRALTEEREKRTIRTAFQAYLHPDLVAELTQNLDSLELGGHRIECSILFADVRNFTGIAEQMSSEQLVALMNQYFDPIAQVIIHEGGYIDKFIGDAVMAVFGAPKATSDHALQACRAALAMQATVQELAPQFRQQFGIENFSIGIGLHSGEVIAGNIGTKERLNYTVMGDPVNLAARLEAATKALGANICMSEAMYQRVADRMEARFIDSIAVKGKQGKVRVFELCGSK